MFSNAFGPLNATGTAPGTEFKQARSHAPDNPTLLTPYSRLSSGPSASSRSRMGPWHELTAFLRSFMGADRFCMKVRMASLRRFRARLLMRAFSPTGLRPCLP